MPLATRFPPFDRSTVMTLAITGRVWRPFGGAIHDGPARLPGRTR